MPTRQNSHTQFPSLPFPAALRIHGLAGGTVFGGVPWGIDLAKRSVGAWHPAGLVLFRLPPLTPPLMAASVMFWGDVPHCNLLPRPTRSRSLLNPQLRGDGNVLLISPDSARNPAHESHREGTRGASALDNPPVLLEAHCTPLVSIDLSTACPERSSFQRSFPPAL